MKVFRLSLFIFLYLTITITITIFLTACGDKNPSGTPTDIPADDKTWDIPVINMNDKTITLFTSGWFGGESPEDILPDEYTDEPVNDAAYERRIKIETTYNCKIVHRGSIESPDEHAKLLINSVNAGDKAYDIAMVRGFGFANLLTGNILLELSELENIDFDNPWWRKGCSDALIIAGRRYGVSGNITSAEISGTAVVKFVKRMIADNGLESPYELVKKGEWTFDKMIEMAKAVSQVSAGSGKMDGSATWGIWYDRDRIWNLLNGCGIDLIKPDADGIPQIVIDSGNNAAKIQDIFNRFCNEAYSLNWRRIEPDEGAQILFSFDWAVGVISSRASEIDFGIIPPPKYDLNQQDYLPNVYGLGVPIICVPSTNGDFENTGMFLEAFSYEGYRTVIPEYYENLLKTKSARDDESEDMIDFIFGNLHYDMGTLLNIDSFTQTVASLSDGKTFNIASLIERNKPRLQRAIDKILDDIEAD
jgi:hypothetical protein